MVLDFLEQDYLRTFNNTAFCVGVVKCRAKSDDNVENWLISNFTNIYWRGNWGSLTVNRIAPLFKKPFRRKFKLCIIKKNLIENLTKDINKNNYICVLLNERYVPDRKSFAKKDFLHDCFINGYDSQKKVFYCWGYDASFKFTMQELSYDLLEKAAKYIYISFNYDESYNISNINYLKLKRNLQGLIYSKYRKNGLNAYDYVVSKVESAPEFVDMRDLRVIKEHIYILKLTGKLFGVDFDDSIELSEIIFNKGLKYNFTHKQELRDGIVADIRKLRDVIITEVKLILDIIGR